MKRAVALTILLAASAFAAPKPRVAVLYFDVSANDAAMQVLNKGLAQMLITDLATNEKLEIVERQRLEDVMKELDLQSSKRFDPETAQKLGKLLLAQYEVLGSVQANPMKPSEVRVSVRVVDVELGKVVAINPAIVATVKDGEVFDAEAQIADRLHGELAKLAKVEAAPQPKKQGKLSLDNAVKYSQALDAIDKKDKKTAQEKLQQVVKAQPDFLLASLELDRLMK